MNLIPDFYQELDTVIQSSATCKAKTLCFLSPDGGAGVSSLTLSVAARLQKASKRVLVLDLNQCHPMIDEFVSSDADIPNWRFDTISTQLSINVQKGFHFLSVTTLDCQNSARDKQAVVDAFERWRQEFDYILIDISPLLRVNQRNIPTRVFAEAAEMTVLVVSAGVTSEESLVSANQKLIDEGFQNVHVVLSQFALPPLGPRLLQSLEKLQFLPGRMRSSLTRFVQRQVWLFKPIGG